MLVHRDFFVINNSPSVSVKASLICNEAAEVNRNKIS